MNDFAMRARPILAAATLCALSCSQQALPPPAHIVATNSIALVDDLLFVTSPGASELRVLNLRASPRDFVRAPNPLEPLAIPVLAAPTTLARDIEYNADGDIDDTNAPYVYVQGAASAEISIVGTQRDTQLVELNRVLADGIVTAIAARAPSASEPRSTLYYATLDENQGRLWQLKIPPSDSAGRMIGAPEELTSLSYGPGGGDSGRVGGPISSIAVMPNQRIAVASRVAGTGEGRTILLDTSHQNGQQWVLDFRGQLDSFPSRPFRQLVTHPTVYRLDDAGALSCPAGGGSSCSVVLPAGARLFGLEDDDACGTSTDCPGILAVDTLPSSPRFTRRSLDASGYEMVPIRFGTGLISGLSIAPQSGRSKPGADLAFPGPSVQTIDLLGIATTSSGFIVFFDAVALGVFNVSGDLTQAVTVAYQTDTGDTVPTYVEGPVLGTQRTDISPAPVNPGIAVALGAALDETVFVTYQGTINGFRDVPVPGGLLGGETELPAGTGDLNHLSPGADRIVVTAGDCTSEVPLTSLRRSPPVLVTSNPIACSGAATFSVRAGGTQTYIVEGNTTGYMGRTGNSQTFAFPAAVGDRAGRYFYHQAPDLSRPELAPFDPTVPQLQFVMGNGDPSIQRDYRYSITIASGYAPEWITADTGSLGADFHAPGYSAYARAFSDGTDVSRLYVAYPSANAILEFQPQLLTPNAANARYITVFR